MLQLLDHGCASFLEDFVDRKLYSTKIPELDELLKEGGHRMLYQELIMKYLIWLGIPETGSYDIIKKIAKKKFTTDELDELKSKLKKGWKAKLNTEDGFEETWQTVEDASRYSFNACISGDLQFGRASMDRRFKRFNIRDTYKIIHDREYARQVKASPLHSKWKQFGVGGIRCINDNNEVVYNKAIDIRYAGIQKIYRLKTEIAGYIDCTLNHKFPTPNGVKMLSELKVGDEVYVYAHSVKAAALKIKSIEFLKEGDTYDVEMDDPYHNFLVDTGIFSMNSHSLAYAYDSLYGAYLKSHYPLEYYTTAFNIYSDDLERTPRLIEEMAYWKIKLYPPKFRHSTSNYACDKENNAIYKGLSSIKFLNENCANELYNRKEKVYNNFIELLVDLTENSSINSKQIKILISLDFFEEFGKALKLMNIYKEFTEGQFKYLKTYCDKTKVKRLDELNKMEFYNLDFPIKEKIASQIEYLGSPSISNENLKGFGYVMDINTKGTPRLTIFGLGTGKTTLVKTYKNIYNKNPINKGDIIGNCKLIQKSKVKKEGEKWVDTGELEWWMGGYEIQRM